MKRKLEPKKTIDALAKHSQKLLGKAYTQAEIEGFYKSIDKDKKDLWTRYLSKYSDKKANGNFDKFWSFEEFVLWYDKQPKECSYCKVKQNELNELFKFKYIESKKPSFSAKLQIDRKNPNNGYFADNCVLACCVCNNAKSDMISEEDFKKFFVRGIRDFMAELLKRLKADKK
ncbi:hypothetical protein BKN38_09965 [Helicobacter sp. CLO-3]|uniref:hypothetical protein n=1 Tax=unclassified Helicobacter TaxID=2593540 RepID=UPI000806043F|nr:MULTISPECIES: hypothetical protein [unclassified Helicobacter]OBV28369.1 hypothetical protein BA723_09675 [Helicobacter sp. CLO-3]OHU80994.1 hypothetical protein BKN38_09965 [Helicobacter sp. CLO-3]